MPETGCPACDLLPEGVRPAAHALLHDPSKPVPTATPSPGAVATYSERAWALWVKRLAEAEAEVERYELRLSRVLGRLLAARKRARTYRRKITAAEEEVALGQAEVRHA